MPILRIVFMGTAELACPAIEALAKAADFQIAGVVTQPDRPKGRDLKLQPPPVKQLAQQLGLPLFQPERIRRPEALQPLKEWVPDLIAVAAYGQIVPASILNLPRWGCLNVHASLLPKYRGAAPIQWSLLNDDSVTGVTIMQMDEGLDTGNILAQETTPITDADNANTLHDRLADMGAALLVRTIRDYVSGKIVPQPQPQETASYARKISKEDGLLDWTLPARTLWNRIRALNPWPGAFSFQPSQPKPILLKIWQAEVAGQFNGLPGQILAADPSGIVVACGQKALRILSLQREGKRRLSAQEFLLGSGLHEGQMLGTNQM